MQKHNFAYEVHEYEHDRSAESYGLEACECLGVPAEQVFKTLVVQLESNELAVAIVPVNRKLALKALAKVLSAKKANMADGNDVTRSTGYVLGGVSPLGQKRALRTIIDSSAAEQDTVFVSAGKRGLEIELSPRALIELCSAKFAEIAQ